MCAHDRKDENMNNNSKHYNPCEVCSRIKALRKEKKWSLAQVCNRFEAYGLFIRPSTLSKYENGHTTMTPDFLIACSYLYMCSIDYLLLGKKE